MPIRLWPSFLISPKSRRETVRWQYWSSPGSRRFSTDVVGNEHIEILFLKLLGTVFDDIRRLSGKTDQDLMGFMLAQSIEDVRILGHFKIQDVVVFLDLVGSRMSGTVIGNGSGLMTKSQSS